ncbi:hypothetical protein FRC03_003619 [Tulasnella sp. 419]|nr:hypothetical protein FRC03_003619 [Tulasnella sp. 419]
MLSIAKSLVVLVAATSLVSADSYLVSRDYQNQNKHHKRFIDGNGNYNITILHVNDVHAHLDEFTSSGTDCTAGKTCYGGYARLKTKINELRQTYSDSLLINAGDEFQGTLFYSYLGPSVIAQTLNDIKFDAMTIGNHEFDAGEDTLVHFLQNLTFPVVCANINTTNTEFQKLLVPYHIFPQHNLALVAVTTPDIPGISSPSEGTKFLDPVAQVQQTVDYVRSTQNVTRIVVMTHIGYENDINLAKNTRHVNLIVGGHSHTLLGNFEGATGAYPTIATNLDGEEVFVVTAYKWGQYLGKIDVAYDPNGKIVAYTGAPILMDNKTAQEQNLQEQIEQWRVPFDELGKQVIGTTNVNLDQTTCQQKECLLGNVIADAMLWYRAKAGSAVDGSIMNAGGIRATIDQGEITVSEVLTSFPFMNGVVELTFTGQQLWDIFEGIVSDKNSAGQTVTSFVQVSKGISFTYNPKNAPGSRLISLNIGQAEPVPPVNRSKTYKIATIDFLATGGDFFWSKRSDFVTLDTLDVVLQEYIKATTPLNPQLTGRIQTTDKTSPSNTSNGQGNSAVNHTSANSLIMLAAGVILSAWLLL